MIVIPPSGWTTQPWKNGGGVTHEILRKPLGAGFAVRISVAEVAADGPFSRFPGIDRSITLIEGRGFRLTRDDGAEVLFDTVGVPFSFHGEDGWIATLLDGPVRDFNVMVDRSALRTSVQLQQAPFRASTAGRCLLFTLDEGLSADGTELPRWALVDGGGAVEVDGSGRALVIGLV